MGDIMTDSYQYDELEEQYDYFRLPAAAIYLSDETENIMKQKNIAVENLFVSLSDAESSSVNIEIGNAFQEGSWNVREDVKSNFAPGTILRVALGYGDCLTTVFHGYVEEFRIQYQAVPKVSVTAMDCRGRLMQHKKSMCKYSDKKASDIFRELLQCHEDLYGNLHITDTNDPMEIMQDTDNLSFIRKELCPRAGRRFYVAGGDVYFVEPESGDEGYLKLEWGKNLISFHKGSKYCKQEIQVCSNQDNKEENTVKQEVATDSQLTSLESTLPVKSYELETNAGQQEMNAYLKQKAEEENQRIRTGGGSVIGLPELVPGRYLEIGNVDESMGGVCYISRVTHSFGSDGFTSQFTIGKDEFRLSENGEQDEDSKEKARTQKKYGVMRGVVKENWDEEHPGRVRVELLSGNDGKNTTEWIPVAQPYCGKDFGFYFLPEINTEVLVGFIEGDVNTPIVLGGLWNQEDTIPTDTANEQNSRKRLRTKGGHEILFQEDEDDEQMVLQTAGGLMLSMGDKDQIISVMGESGKNLIQLDEKNNEIQISADQKVILSAGGKEMLVLDGGSGTCSITADTVKLKGKQTMQMEANSLKVKGNASEYKADGSLKMNCSGVLTIKGSMVKLN